MKLWYFQRSLLVKGTFLADFKLKLWILFGPEHVGSAAYKHNTHTQSLVFETILRLLWLITVSLWFFVLISLVNVDSFLPHLKEEPPSIFTLLSYLHVFWISLLFLSSSWPAFQRSGKRGCGTWNCPWILLCCFILGWKTWVSSSFEKSNFAYLCGTLLPLLWTLLNWNARQLCQEIHLPKIPTSARSYWWSYCRVYFAMVCEIVRAVPLCSFHWITLSQGWSWGRHFCS